MAKAMGRGWGGARPGAGRKPKPKDPNAIPPDYRRKPEEKRAIAEIARPYGVAAVSTLHEIMTDPKAPKAARVAAANSLLDRGYGRPVQEVRGAGTSIVLITDLNLRGPLEDQSHHDAEDAYTITVRGNGQSG
jgi:hypothetical protein